MILLAEKIQEKLAVENAEGDDEWLARKGASPKLHISSLAGCHRNAHLTMYEKWPEHPLHQPATNPHSEYLKALFQLGKDAEKRTFNDLLYTYERVGMEGGFRLESARWVGEADFFIPPCEDWPTGVIVEHKETSPWGFSQATVPYSSHLYQVLGYQHMFEQEYGERPEAVLFYRLRDWWAQFTVEQKEYSIEWNGTINSKPKEGFAGKYKQGFLVGILMPEMERLEVLLGSDSLPPTLPSPFAEQFACVSRGPRYSKVNCKWFDACWPALAGQEVLETPEAYR